VLLVVEVVIVILITNDDIVSSIKGCISVVVVIFATVDVRE